MPDETKQSKPDESKQSKPDIFIARTIYPEANAVFTARYKSLSEIKGDCVVVLDTNTLLIPYSIGKESLEEIKTTYQTLIDAKRLVIPAQVAREFAKNRSLKIADLFDSLSKKCEGSHPLQLGRYPLLEALPSYQNSLTVEREINKLLLKYREGITEVLAHIREWNWDDPVSLLYGELFGALVVDTQVGDDLTKEDLMRRQTHKIAPAYKDASKTDGGSGDLIIWQTILEIGKKEKKSVLFVSHDEKSDWWHRSAGQPLYPRYELLDEFRRASDGQTFHIVRFSRFLELFDATQPAVDEVREREQVTALEDLDVEILVLDAFERSSYKLRSAGGIARDTGIPREKCQKAMSSLEQSGVLGKTITRKGGVRWYIVPKAVKG